LTPCSTALRLRDHTAKGSVTSFRPVDLQCCRQICYVFPRLGFQAAGQTICPSRHAKGIRIRRVGTSQIQRIPLARGTVRTPYGLEQSVEELVSPVVFSKTSARNTESLRTTSYLSNGRITSSTRCRQLCAVNSTYMYPNGASPMAELRLTCSYLSPLC
jgi:hypothetical protein